MISIELKRKAQKIKLAAFDIDGVMTDGGLIYLPDGSEAKMFNAKDGLGLSMIHKAGIITAIITAKDAPVVLNRAEVLNIDKVYLNQRNKIEAFEEILKEYNIAADEVLYMGDDLPDMEVLKACGLSACPNDAIDEVIEICDYVTVKTAGHGAVREVCNLLLESRNITFNDLRNPHKQ